MTTTPKRGKLTAEQQAQLLKPINPVRVFSANGQSHVPAYDVAAHLTRIFGFGGWTKEILRLELLVDEKTQTKNGRDAYTVTYGCDMRLTVFDADGNYIAHWDDTACGSSTQPQHGEALDMARKSAASYALKRCAAFGLGDQFGLSLYNKGMIGILVGATLVGPEVSVTAGSDVEAHAPKAESMGNDELDLPDVDQATGVITTPAPAPAPAAAPAGPAPVVAAGAPVTMIATDTIKQYLFDAIVNADPTGDHKATAIERWTNFQAAHGVADSYPEPAALALINAAKAVAA